MHDISERDAWIIVWCAIAIVVCSAIVCSAICAYLECIGHERSLERDRPTQFAFADAHLYGRTTCGKGAVTVV